MINFNESRTLPMKRRSFTFLITYFFTFLTIVSYSQEFEMPGYISDLSACDFDNNGALDILVTCPYTDTLVMLYNNGFGGFENNAYEISALHAICGCVDEDSVPDLIAGVGQHYFYKSNGDRTFENGVPILTFSGTITVYGLIDLNDDGWNDLLYTNTSDEYWGIYKNNGNLTFTNEIIQSGSSTTFPAAGLITDDSLPDIVLTYSAFDRSSVNINNGNFNFTEVVLEQTFIGQAFVMNIDNLGTDDFAFANYYTKTVPLYKFIGNDQFEFQSNFYAEGTYPLSSFLPADFNQDGYDDFAITRGDWWNSSDSLYIYLNDHNWSFNLHQILYIGIQTWFKSCASDLNGDAFPDIYMKGCNGSNILTILWNNGNGFFSFENPVGIYEQSRRNHLLRIFPNPFTNQINVEVIPNLNDGVSITISNIYGSTVKTFIITETELSANQTITWDGYNDNKVLCTAGIYIVTVRSDSIQFSQKVLKY